MSDAESPLVFTDSAANKVAQLIADEGNDALKLRVFVSGGGCSGFQYGFTFDESVNDGDTEVEVFKGKVRVKEIAGGDPVHLAQGECKTWRTRTEAQNAPEPAPQQGTQATVPETAPRNDAGSDGRCASTLEEGF